MAAAKSTDPAHTLFLEGRHDTPEFKKFMTELDAQYAWYATGLFFKERICGADRAKSQLLEKTVLLI